MSPALAVKGESDGTRTAQMYSVRRDRRLP
jgi:hypothetical protein